VDRGPAALIGDFSGYTPDLKREPANIAPVNVWPGESMNGDKPAPSSV
jgi:hypothetical protein